MFQGKFYIKQDKITNNNKMIKFLSILIMITCLCLRLSGKGRAKVVGKCENCHTMHNSQNNSPMATYGADDKPWKGEGPYKALTRGSCLGCHGMGTGNNIETIGGEDGASDVPQVYHTDPNDLAGGNFAYILGAKGSGASDAKGHNIMDLGQNDGTLTSPPGGGPHVATMITNQNLTCSGQRGCHGYPDTNGYGIEGAHHGNIDGLCNDADHVYNSYRFLLGVTGLENTVDKWRNVSATSHNEYSGESLPPSDVNNYCLNCHAYDGPIKISISHLCATCHGNYHIQNGYGSDPGIGGDPNSPFTRHPTDIVIKDEGEYAVVNRTYNKNIPLGRLGIDEWIPETASIIQNATDEDVVICLSCHVAHASDYPDLLRWNYADMRVGGGGSGGCFACHTEKN